MCSIRHASGSVTTFPSPMTQPCSSPGWSTWAVSISIRGTMHGVTTWIGRDYLHFDLDPTPRTPFALVRDAALPVRDALVDQGMRAFPAEDHGISRSATFTFRSAAAPPRRPTWTVAKTLARALAAQVPRVLTAEYRVARRPERRVLIDYNQNAWGRTLASVHSVRPTPNSDGVDPRNVGRDGSRRGD